MKKITIIIAISLCFSIVSCNKDNIENSYCIKNIQNSPTTTILSNSEMDVVKYLFNRNQLDYTKYLFTKFQEDELGYHHIRCYQFANNLIVFTSDVIFHFDKNDNYYFLSDELINEINLNTKSLMTRDNIVEKYIDIVTNDEDFLAWLRLLEEMVKVDETVEVIHIEDIIENCFDIEFGYYNLNAGISYAEENYTKAWKIKPSDRDYPYAYINDEDLEIIYYDNGFRY